MQHKDITQQILGCYFDVINELGVGFLESVYKKALLIALEEKKFYVEEEKRLAVNFRGKQVGIFVADIIVNNSVIVELKCCKSLTGEHSAQVINYLKATNVPIGLLVNFGNKELEFKRLYIPGLDPANLSILLLT
jgi:GxxExxY protein